MKFSNNDERKLLAFLLRAGTALRASGWQPGSIGLLDWHRANDAANPAHRAAHPELGALADEFYGPNEFDGDCKTLAELYRAFMGANAEGEVEFHFRTFAHEETSNWELEGTPLAKLAPFPIFGLYMIREGDRWGYGAFLENIFCYPALPDDAPKNQYGQDEIDAFFDTNEGSDMVHNGEGWEGAYSADAAAMDADSRFSERMTFAVPAGDLVFTDMVMEALAPEAAWDYEANAKDALLENLMEQAAEAALDYFRGNAMHPKAVLAA